MWHVWLFAPLFFLLFDIFTIMSQEAEGYLECGTGLQVSASTTDDFHLPGARVRWVVFAVSAVGGIEDAKVNLTCSGAVRWVVFGVSTVGCIEDAKVNLTCSGAVWWVVFGVSTVGCIEDAKVNLTCSGAVRWVVFAVSTMGCIEDAKVNLLCSGASRVQIEVQCDLDVHEAFRNALNNCLVTLGPVIWKSYLFVLVYRVGIAW